MLAPHPTSWDDIHPLLTQRSGVSRSSSRSSRKSFRQLSQRERAIREKGWVANPYISTPSALKGINLQAGKLPREEPWSLDASWFVQLLQLQDPVSKDSTAHARFWDATSREVYKEESWSSSERKKTLQKRAELGKVPWDNRPMRSEPWALRGLKPVTKEPWFSDMKIREKHDPDKLRRQRKRQGVPSPYEQQDLLLLC